MYRHRQFADSKRKAQENVQSISVKTNTNIVDSDVTDHRKWLEKKREPWEEVKNHWEATATYRLKRYGEVVNINLVRDKFTGKQKGYGFLCFEDQRSTVLAVDNLNGIKILGRTIRVDHVENYKPPKNVEKLVVETKKLRKEACAPTSK